MSLLTTAYSLETFPKEKAEAFIASKPETLLYTSFPYLQMLKAFLACEVQIITVSENDQVIGFMPLAFKHNTKHGCVCNSLPFYGSNGGMIVDAKADGEKVRKALLQKFYELVEERNCIAYTVISNPLDPEGDAWLRSNIKHDLVDQRIGQITHFPESSGDSAATLMSSFEDPRPRNIRKAQKEGVEVRALNTGEAMEFLYQTHFDNITAINGIPKEKRFFDMIPDFFSDNEYKVYIAELNGEKIAALLLFFYNRTVEYFTPAVVEKFRNAQPTALIIYQAMLDAISRGYQNWNWGGTWLSQGGVYDFKKKWGTSDHNYFYYTRVAKDDVYKMSKEDLLSEYPYFFVLPFSALK